MFATAAAAAVLLAALQTPGSAPSYGMLSLDAGFADDPRAVRVRAGGAISAYDLDPACSGFISDAPTLSVDYAAGALPLYVYAVSGDDTTLIVRMPDGSYACNDDQSGFDPGVEITDPQSGRYDVWLGTFGAGVGYPEATLSVSEIGFSGENPYRIALDPGAEAATRLRLSAGFRDDPRTLTVSAGGRAEIAATEGFCAGYADPEPDVALDYEAGGYPLYIAARSQGDTTLIVRTPDGGYVCDDDGAGDLNPGVAFREPQSGEYLIWTGTYSDGDRQPAELLISERGLLGEDNSLDVLLPAVFGGERLQAPMSPDPFAVRLEAGGPVRVQQEMLPGVVSSGYCTGYVTRAPSFELDWNSRGPLFLSAIAASDLTLMVNAPDGGWWCDDDGAGDLNPGIVFSDAEPGVYDIYVGAYGASSAGEAADLFISTRGFGEKPGDAALDPDAPANHGALSLAPGFDPSLGERQVQAGGSIDASRSPVGLTDPRCRGYVDAAPTLTLDWPGSQGSLHVYAASQTDTTLLVRGPDGAWSCNDDDLGLDPGVTLSPSPAGRYAIYLGTYGEDDGGAAALTISERPRPLEE